MTGRRSLIPLLIILNTIVFLLWTFGGPDYESFMSRNFTVSWDLLAQGRFWVTVTAVFSHNWLPHFLINMLVLRSFGSLLEEVLGSFRFLRFYLIAGIISSLTHAIVSAWILGETNLAALGASGSLAGMVLLFSLMFPREKILLFGILPMPALLGALAFVGLDIWGLTAQAKGGGLPIGHGAHLGGALAGAAYYFLSIRERWLKVAHRYDS